MRMTTELYLDFDPRIGRRKIMSESGYLVPDRSRRRTRACDFLHLRSVASISRRSIHSFLPGLYGTVLLTMMRTDGLKRFHSMGQFSSLHTSRHSNEILVISPQPPIAPRFRVCWESGYLRIKLTNSLIGTLMNHTNVVKNVQPQIELNIYHRQQGRKFTIGETNSISGQGAHGVSDVFGSALWLVDYCLYIASQVLFFRQNLPVHDLLQT